MNDMVERLAKKWGERTYHSGEAEDAHARWWLNAIADELEDAMPLKVGKRIKDAVPYRWDIAADHLRRAAK